MRDPELFSTFVDNCVLVRVVISGSRAGRGSEEVLEGFEVTLEWVVDDRGNVFGSGGNGCR